MRLIVIFAALSFAVGCSSAADAPAPAGPPAAAAPAGEPPADDAEPKVPRFVPTSCRYVVPKSAEGKSVRCGDVLVKENHDEPGGRTISIHVAVFPGDPKMPPVFELIGGPGGGGDPMVGFLAAGEARAREDASFVSGRGDYVVFDQRGVGRSEPNLSCAEEMLSAGPTSSFIGVMERCRDRLTSANVDLSRYTTYDNALDVDDIRVALGYEKIDLHAISYGTLLALEVLRQRPSGIRSVIIDGVLPPEAKLLAETPRTIDEDLTRIFTSCAAQPACAAAFPDLEGSFAALHGSLDQSPLASSMTGPFDWYQFVGVLEESMYSPDGVRRIPLMVHDLAARGQAALDDLEASFEGGPMTAADEGPLVREVEEALDALFEDPVDGAKYLGMNDGMYTSVTCSDSGQYETYEDAVKEGAKVRPGLFDPDGLREQLAICEMWPKAAKRATTKAPVTADVPTLSMGGEFDPVTPFYWAEQATKTLSNATYLFMPGLAHGSMDACSRAIKGAFFADPRAALDTACNASRALSFATSWQESSSLRSAKRAPRRPRPRPVPRPVVRPVIRGR